MTVKVYRLHRCDRHHTSERTFLRCAIRGLAWVQGSGPFASVAWCWPPTVTLHTTADAAEESKLLVDATGCGGRCRGRHDLIQIELDK